MRYILALLVSVSAFAVEEISQTVTTRINTPIEAAFTGLNDGRGGEPSGTPLSIWVVRHTWNGDTSSTRQLTRFSHPDGAAIFATTVETLSSNFTQMQAFNSWNAAQTLSLVTLEVQAIIESDSTGGGFAIKPGAFIPTNISGPKFTYTPALNFVGSQEVVLLYRRTNVAPEFQTEYRRIRLTLNVINDAPTISLSASPSTALIGTEVALPAVTADANGHAVSVSYDYGDGSTGNAASHTYSTAGVYTVTATTSDGFGGTSTASTVVTIVGNENTPTARFTTSDVVAFVGVPFVLDGITSTDPQNAIESYAWDFGDNTPLGSKPTLSHIYLQTGTVTIRFTVTDSEGLSSTLTRDIEVLPAEAAATFDAEVRVTTTYFPQKQGRDTVSVFARVNIGDTQLVTGSLVALEYAGKRFTATLDKRGKGLGWTVKQNLRRQAPGTVEVTLKARNVDIAALLEAAGAIDDGTVDIPFRLELGPKTILVDVPTDFEVSTTRGKGLGQLD